MVPAASPVLERPDLAGTGLRRRRDASEVRGEGPAPVIGFDSPGAEERRDRIVGRLSRAPRELEEAGARDRSLDGVRDQRGGHLAHVGRGWITDDAELEERADARILRIPRERLGER